MTMLSDTLEPAGPERMCVLTRAVKPTDRLVRFVAGPDGQVVPDIRNRLPGRGVWLSLGRATIEEAIRKRVFARGLKENVTLSADLGGEVGRLLAADALQMLSFANKAGAIVAGFEKIASGRWPIEALVQAHDGSASERARLRQSCHGRGPNGGDPTVISAFSSDEIALSIGRETVIHAALKVHPVCASFLGRAERYAEFLADGPTGGEKPPVSGPSAFPDASHLPDASQA
jgi:hypothetical protein